MAQRFANAARGVLALAIAPGTTTIQITEGGDLFPVISGNDWFKAVLQDEAGIEIIRVNARTGNVFTVVRGQEGTTARAFSVGTTVGLRITAADVEGSIATANNSVQLTGDQAIGGVKTFTSHIVAGAGRYSTGSDSVAMYEMRLVGHVAAAWRLQLNGTAELVVTDGQGVVGSTLLSATTAGHLTATGNITAGGQFIGNVIGNVIGNAATATALQTARTINGVSFNGTDNITTNSWGTARTLTIGSTGKSVDGSGNVSWTLEEIGAPAANSVINADGNYLVHDTRSVDTPTDMGNMGVRYELKYNTTDGLHDGGVYHTVMTIQNWSDLSGGNTHQLGFGQNGNLWHRTATIGGTWDAWRAQLNSANFNSFAPTLTGAGASGTWGISVTGNAATVTNGVYTTGDQTIGGIKTFNTSNGLRALGAIMLRQDTSGEGGELSFQRASDATIHYYLDVIGTGTTPSFRLVNAVRDAQSWAIDHSGNMNAEGNITAGGQFIGNGSVPPGAVMYFAMNSPPTGWLRANGAAVSRTTFAALFAVLSTHYGAGDGSTTFNLPDLRGEFLRGWDDGRGVDSGRIFGSAQGDLVKSHVHDFVALQNLAGGDGMYDHNGVSNIVGANDFSPMWSQTAGLASAAENRPRNVALLACIKF